MKSSEIHFTGVWQTRLDSSLRLCIRAGWRQMAGDLLYMLSSRNRDHPLIKVLMQENYDEKLRLIMTSSKAPLEKWQLAAKLAQLCSEVRPDPRNRILIPPDMVHSIGLQKCRPVTLVGCGNHFEIWETGNYQAFLNQGHSS